MHRVVYHIDNSDTLVIRNTYSSINSDLQPLHRAASVLVYEYVW